MSGLAPGSLLPTGGSALVSASDTLHSSHQSHCLCLMRPQVTHIQLSDHVVKMSNIRRNPRLLYLLTYDRVKTE